MRQNVEYGHSIWKIFIHICHESLYRSHDIQISSIGCTHSYLKYKILSYILLYMMYSDHILSTGPIALFDK